MTREEKQIRSNWHNFAYEMKEYGKLMLDEHKKKCDENQEFKEEQFQNWVDFMKRRLSYYTPKPKEYKEISEAKQYVI